MAQGSEPKPKYLARGKKAAKQGNYIMLWRKACAIGTYPWARSDIATWLWATAQSHRAGLHPVLGNSLKLALAHCHGSSKSHGLSASRRIVAQQYGPLLWPGASVSGIRAKPWAMSTLVLWLWATTWSYRPWLAPHKGEMPRQEVVLVAPSQQRHDKKWYMYRTTQRAGTYVPEKSPLGFCEELQAKTDVVHVQDHPASRYIMYRKTRPRYICS